MCSVIGSKSKNSSEYNTELSWHTKIIDDFSNKTAPNCSYPSCNALIFQIAIIEIAICFPGDVGREEVFKPVAC